MSLSVKTLKVEDARLQKAQMQQAGIAHNILAIRATNLYLY